MVKKEFLSDDFLLNNSFSQLIYSKIRDLPILDYHCHLDAKEICDNLPYETITDAWLGFDHYKFRAMRIMGVDEAFITGNAPKQAKFEAWSSVLGTLIGHPLYHFSHLELKNYFGITTPLNKNTAARIYETANKKLPNLTPKGIIKASNVELIVTTNDPLEDLKYHKRLKTEFDVKVLPAFRPDKAINIDKDGFLDYIKTLSTALNMPIESFDDIKKALILRLDYFCEVGCVAADHGLDWFCYQKDYEILSQIAAKKALLGQKPSFDEAEAYKTALLMQLATEYKKRDIVMELHFGVSRNNNQKAFEKLGPDKGFDTIRTATHTDNLVAFLNQMEANDSLPKTIIFSLNPSDNAQIATIMGSFQQKNTKGYVQQGAAWWFNDSKIGMQNHLQMYASLNPIDSFLGMLTDSRSLFSYARHEYFRRILAQFLGNLVENGEYPASDMDNLVEIAKNIAYFNVKHFFKL